MAPTTSPVFAKAFIAFCTFPTLTGLGDVEAVAGAATLRTSAAAHATEATRVTVTRRETMKAPSLNPNADAESEF
jgi:hypothetical protein